MARRVELIARSREYDGFLKLDEARFRYEKFDGTMSAETTRLILERGDSAGVLLYHRLRRTVLLIEQFRYPAYVRDGPGWLLEIVAGVIEDDAGRITVAHRELLEETGYSVPQLHYLGMVFPSPGGSSERIYLYLGFLDESERTGPGGGLASEEEDIRTREIPLQVALRLIERGEICDAKTIIALQHLALHPPQEV